MRVVTYKNIARCPACRTELVEMGKKQMSFGTVTVAKCPYCGFLTQFSNIVKNGPNPTQKHAKKGDERT